MNGIGFGEILLIALLVLLFFGSKELPDFIRKAAQFMGKIKQATDRVRSEIDSIATPITSMTPLPDAGAQRRNDVRIEYRAHRKEVPEASRKSAATSITQHITQLPSYAQCTALMVYVSAHSEVDTSELIAQCFIDSKRVIVPYCKEHTNTMGIAEIKNVQTDLELGSCGIREPIKTLRDNFLRSDLTLIICPGIAFDRFGGRLGNGKGYYDSFLRELKGRCHMVGIGYSCQILDNSLPFSYHDIPMDQVITENGPLITQALQQQG